MGSLFSKEKDKRRKDDKPGSAPSRLEGLDGTTPVPEVPKRALTPPTTATRPRDEGPSPVAVSAPPDSPSPASTASPSDAAERDSKRPRASVEEAPSPPAAKPSSPPQQPQRPASQPPKPLAVEQPNSSSPPPPPRAPSPPLPRHQQQHEQQQEEQLQHSDSQSEQAAGAFGAAGQQDATTPTRRAPKKIDYVGAQSDGTKLAADLPAAVQVPDDAAGWTAVLGESTVRNLHSPDWKTREHALQAVMRCMGNARWNAERSPEDIWTTVTQLLDKSLKDKVAPLYYASLELLSTLVASYSGSLPYSSLTQGLEPIMPTLLHRVGNNNARIQETSIQALLTLANQPALGLAFLAPHALSAIPKKSQHGAAAASQMSGRLELITCMLNVQVQQQMGFGTAGRTPAAAAAAGRGGADALSAEDIVRFTRPALDMPDDKVRTAAVRLVAEVYRTRKAAGQPFEVDKMLGAGIKPALMQVLHRRFAEVDEELAGGGPSAAGGKRGSANAVDETPVGPGISIKAPGSTGGRGSALPPLSGRFGSLPALAVVGSRGGSPARPPFGAPQPPSSADAPGPGGKPPRTPLSPGSRGRTPPRSGAGAGPARGASPMRGSRGHDGVGLLPGSLPDTEGGGGGVPDVLMIHSGNTTPARGNSSQSVRNGSSQSMRNGSAQSGRGPSSLKPRSRDSAGRQANALDDAEEQLIEYILNDEARAAH